MENPEYEHLLYIRHLPDIVSDKFFPETSGDHSNLKEKADRHIPIL